VHRVVRRVDILQRMTLRDWDLEFTASRLIGDLAALRHR
jgi:hypothetical protein